VIEEIVKSDVKKSNPVPASLLRTLDAAAQLWQRLVGPNCRFQDRFNAFCGAKCVVQELTRLLQTEPSANASQLVDTLRQVLALRPEQIKPEYYHDSLWGIDVLLACSMPGDSSRVLLSVLTEINPTFAEAIKEFKNEKECHEAIILVSASAAVPQVPKHIRLQERDVDALSRNKKRRFAMTVLGALKLTIEQIPRLCEDKW
jgi:hypothetical protein